MLDDKTVLEIRKKRLKGTRYADLSTEYQLALCVIRSICKNRSFQHVPLGFECSQYQYDKRYAIGIQTGSAKLNEFNVKTIRDLISQGFHQKQVASLYQVSISTISDINTGRSWQHLP